MPARLVVCEQCHLHAHIVAENGCVGVEFGFQEHGKSVVSEGFTRGLISAEDAETLGAAIEKSNLPVRYTDADILLLWKIEVMNHLRVQHGVEDMVGRQHESLSASRVTPEEVPADFHDHLARLHPSST